MGDGIEYRTLGYLRPQPQPIVRTAATHANDSCLVESRTRPGFKSAGAEFRCRPDGEEPLDSSGRAWTHQVAQRTQCCIMAGLNFLDNGNNP